MNLTQQLLDAIRGIVREESEKIADNKITGLETKFDGLHEEMTRQNNETRVLVENGYQRIENLLREDC